MSVFGKMKGSQKLCHCLYSHSWCVLPVRYSSGTTVGPLTLEPNQLPELTKQLQDEFPASLNIYHMANNIVRKKYAWPGLEFLVDRFPEFAVCLCRTAGGLKKNLPPLGNEVNNVYIFSRNSQALENFLKMGGVIDWNQRTSFMMLRNPVDSTIVRNYCEKMGGTVTIPARYYVERELFINVDLKKLQPREKVPDGFRVGVLEGKHARQMAEELEYGHPKNNEAYFRYLIESGFPSVAIFTDDGLLVGYVIMRAEFCAGAAHINPDYRKNGLMKVMVKELWWKLREMGEENTYGDVDQDNVASLTGMKSMGATIYPKHEDFQAFLYTPASSAEKK